MARKAQIVYKKSGQRLKQLLDEYDMTQTQLSEIENVGLSRTTINQVIKGHKTLSEASANEIVQAFPNENPKLLKEWLMGRTDYRNTKEQLFSTMDEVHREGSLLSAGLSAFANLCGFSITDASPLDKDNPSLENFIRNIGDGHTISRNGDSVTLTPLQMNKLQNEICDYIEFTLDRIVTGKRSV